MTVCAYHAAAQGSNPKHNIKASINLSSKCGVERPKRGCDWPAFSKCFFLNWANSGLFFVLFSVFFKQTLQFLQQINVKKCPSSLRRRDSNPRPFEHESSPITTRPGLPPKLLVNVTSFAFSERKTGFTKASF